MSRLSAEELDQTKEDDLSWLALKEETIIFNEAFVSSKYGELESHETGNNDDFKSKKRNNTQMTNELELAHKLIGLIEIEESDFKKNAIDQWNSELLDMCFASGDSSSSFLSVLKKRLAVQQRLHTAYLREQQRKSRPNKLQNQGEEEDDEGEESKEYPTVPVVVRLGVLTLFPLIQSLSGIKDANYPKLCSQVLGILLNVLATLPPLALHEEPADCLDAFEDFILSLLKEDNYTIKNQEKAQAIIALVGLIISRGNAKDLLLLTDVLFQINNKSSELYFPVSGFMKQLSEHKKDGELSVFFDRGYIGSWAINNMQIDSSSTDSSQKDAIATDGAFLYIHSYGHGLRKIGSGYGGTIQGQIYECDSQFRKGEKPKSLACIGNKLYYLLPQSAMTSSEPKPSTASASQPSSSHPIEDDYEAVDESEISASEPEEEDEEDEEGEEEDMDTDEPSAPVLRHRSGSIKSNQQEEEEISFQIAVIDTVTLEEVSIISMKEEYHFPARTQMITDGQYLYFITRRREEEDTEDKKKQSVEKYSVHSFEPHPNGSELTFIKTIDLGEVSSEGGLFNNNSTPQQRPLPSFASSIGLNARLPDVSLILRDAGISFGQSQAVKSGPAVSSSTWDKATFYTTGCQLCVLAQPENSAQYSKTRVYSMFDGKHITDATIDQEPLNSAACYDAKRNVIWSFADESLSEWKNLGLWPKHALPADDSSTANNSSFPSYSPEAILSRPELVVKKEGFQPFQLILMVIANMDRLARQHPIYGEDALIIQKSLPESEYTFCIDVNGKVFETMAAVFKQTLQHNIPEDLKLYILLACSRILKVNMYEAIKSGKTRKELGIDPKDETLSELHKILKDFIEKPPLSHVSNMASTLLRQEACNVITLGLPLFTSNHVEQTYFIVELLENAPRLAEGNKVLLSTILTQLSEVEDISNILLGEEDSSKKNRKDKNKSEDSDKMELDASSPKEKQMARRLLYALIDVAYDEGIESINKPLNNSIVGPLVSSPLKLLLVLQRDIVSNNSYSHLLFDYVCTILSKCKQLVGHILQQHTEKKTLDKNIDHQLKSSLLGVILQPLVLSLWKKKHSSDVAFTKGLLPHLTQFLKEIDSLNKLSSEANEADKLYLTELSSKKEKKNYVESKHPYPHGKNQLKQTVTIPGATGIVLRFDPKCQTSSTSSDQLHLYKSPALTDPVMFVGGKDKGKPMVFSGINWPKRNVVIPGNSVTFVFTANTRVDLKNADNLKHRWGFRVRVTEFQSTDVYRKLISHWLLDLESIICLVAGKYASSMIEGEPVSEDEKKCSSWLETRLLNGGLEPENEANPVHKEFLSDFINGKGEAQILYEWMNKQKKRQMLSAQAKQPLEQVERYSIAAVMKQLFLVDDAKKFASLLASGTEIKEDVCQELFSLLSQDVMKIITNLQARGQLDKLWRSFVDEKPTLEAFSITWRDEKKEKLMEMCELKDVDFDPRDEKTTIEGLYDTLKHEISRHAKEGGGSSSEVNSYQVVAEPIIDRAKLLLRMRPALKAIQSPSIESPNPFAVHRDRPLIIPAKENSTALRASAPGMRTARDIQKDREDHKNRTFERRVQELRKWLQAFQNWKQWQETAAGHPLGSVNSFLQGPLSTESLQKVIQVQTQRARSRVEGLKYFDQLLNLASFSSSRHQILSSIGEPFRSGGHYLESIPTCGAELSRQVSNAFVLVFQQMVRILKEKTDSGSKLLALTIFSLAYTENDLDLLRSANAFSLLQGIVTDCNQFVALKTSKIVSIPKEPSVVSAKPKVNDEETIEQERKEKEDKQELEKQKKLSLSAWTAFRLLATRCVNLSEDVAFESEALKEIQVQIFDLMCAELKSISHKMTIYHKTNNSEHCFELLILLCLLGGSSKGYKSLSKEENITNLISILKSKNIEPRAKRLALRLCSKLLPNQGPEYIPKLIEFFLEEIGSSFYSSALRTDQLSSSDKFKSELGLNAPVPMEEDESEEEDDDEEEESDEEVEDDQYSIYIHHWNQGHQRLIEICQNAMGSDFFVRGAGSDRHTAESRAQQILQEVTEEGRGLLKTCPLANCNILATNLTAVGGTVSIVPVQANAEGKHHSQSRNYKKLARRCNPTPWMSGHVVQSLAAEHIHIIRQLIQTNTSSNVWVNDVKKMLYSVLCNVPNLFNAEVPQKELNVQLLRSLGALAVIGGHTESIRVGGKVEETLTKKKGTIINISNDFVHVIFDNDVSKNPKKIVLSELKAISENEFDGRSFPLTNEILSSLLLLVKQNPSNSNGIPQWLLADMRSRAIKSLEKLLSVSSSANVFLQNTENISNLMKLANEANPSSRVHPLEKTSVALLETLWDSVTKPEVPDPEDTKVKTMRDLLPFYPHASSAELLPTACSVDKLQGFVFRGLERRKFEMIGAEANANLGRRGFAGRAPVAVQTEYVVVGNAPIPLNVNEYYFEVTFDQTENNGAHLSVGIFPEGSKTWGNGSYRYQANAKKTSFDRGNRKQNDYGTLYRAKNTIGCGYNKEEESIYFTKDGVEQGVAFSNIQFGGKVFPAIGLSKGTHVTVNFGQEPFKYKFAVEGETAEQREQRKKDEEEKRKKEKLEEEEARKKERADRRAANLLAAQPILNMGFDLKMALVALKNTGYSGAEAASNWLVENMGNYNFDEAVLSDKEDDEKEEVKEAPKAVEQPKKEEEKEKEKDQAKKEEVKAPEVVKTSEELYSSSASQSFVLNDNFSFHKNESVIKKEPQNKLTADWEESVIPPIKSFMEKDGFSSFEVEEYLQQIRAQLATNNEQQARGIVLQIVGDAGLQIQFPSTSGGGSRDKPTMKIDDIKVGNLLTVSPSLVAGDIHDKNWVSPMDKTIGQTGSVKAIDHQVNMVLLQFYNAELAALSEWWYPLKMLDKSEKISEKLFNELSREELQNRITQNANELANLHARKALLSLLSHAPVTMEGPLNVKDVLNLIASENVCTSVLSLPPLSGTSSSLRTKGEKSSRFYNALESRLLSLYEQNQSSGLTESLVKEAIQCFDAASKLEVDESTKMTFVSAKPPSTSPLLIQCEGASSLVIMFDRSGTSIASNSGTTFSFYSDEAATELVKIYAEKSKFVPFAVPSNKLWLRVNTSSNPNSSRGNKYKFSAVPIHPKLGLAFWIVSFLVDSAPRYIKDLDQICIQLFNTVLDFVYSTTVPSTIKESSFYLLNHLMQTFSNLGLRGSKRPTLPLQRLVKLKDEMVALYEVERKKDHNLFSSYLQSLAELMVNAKEAGAKFLPEESKKEEPVPSLSLFPLLPSLPEKDPKKGKEKGKDKSVSLPPANSTPDDALKIAIALTNQLKEAEKAEQPPSALPPLPPPPPSSSMPPPAPPAAPSSPSLPLPFPEGTEGEDEMEDEEYKLALAMSMDKSNDQSIQSSPASVPSSEPSSAQKVEGNASELNASSDNMSALFEDEDDDDEMMKAAIRMSMESGGDPSSSAPAPAAPSVAPASEPAAAPAQAAESAAPSSEKKEEPVAPASKPEEEKKEDEMEVDSIFPPNFFGLSSSSDAITAANPSSTPSKSKWGGRSKSKKISEIPWLNQIFHIKQTAKSFSMPVEGNVEFRNFVNRAWRIARKETIKERIILMDNLPILDEEKREELEVVLKRTIGEIAMVTSIYMPIDPNHSQTKGYAFIEVASPQKVETVIKKMHRHKLKLPNINDEAIQNLRASLQSSASLPRGTIKVFSYNDIDKAEDPRVVEFLSSKLVQNKVLTPKCKSVLIEIFNSFGGKETGALVSNQLNELQKVSTGRSLSENELDYAFKNYKSIQIGSEMGLTLEGFLNLYERQCLETPLDTWEEFVKLGYDLDLNHNSFVKFEEALSSQYEWTTSHDIQLMSYLENLYTECEAPSPTQLSISHLKPIQDEKSNYPLLASSSLPSLRLRFVMLKEFNRELVQGLHIVNFGRSHNGSLLQILSERRSLIFHTTKMEFIYEILDKTAVTGNQPTVTIDRLKLAAKKEKELKLATSSNAKTTSQEMNFNQTMFGIAYSQMKNVNSTVLCQKKPSGAEPHFAIKIVFKGENVQGEGGPYRQFFTDVSKEMQGVLPLFVLCSNAQQGLGENRDKWIVSSSADSPLHLSMFEFFGRLTGLSVRTGALLPMDLPPIFWKRLVGEKVDLKDLQDIDSSLTTTLDYLSKCTKEEWEATCPEETFAPLLGTVFPSSVNNRKEFLKKVEEAKLREGTLQTKAILAGLSDLIPSPLLSLCTWQDLEWKVCGKPFVDINLLKRHTTCSGVASDAPHIAYFWQTLQEFGQVDRRGFLRFAWAQERLPVNDEEFERTKTRMMIKPFNISGDPNSAFPKADTCFFNIMLPEYSNQKTLRDRLLFAIYTDSHSMNADEPTEDELTTMNGRRAPSYLQESSDSE
eukprot:TRINITY_DN1838_c1_g1_i6.p1 TRINITY_DN1838_c1_g1~~TRINITY_DN1838_c1_g1_i6.p1  ORF type:complete len:4362 (-),score=1676.63 TRINITY_DN1838_c1_g1_i6:38-13123(-)